ncbi:MAG: hypothetical protein LBH97_05670 [Treponema sp.]|jgi:tetratricopeptide (TPR) repeat protein|nr:hypothetical protein [Treponema sp.]
MKKITGVCLFALICAAVFAQAGNTEQEITRTEHFIIFSDPADGKTLAFEMEERFSVYNRLFRFNPGNVAGNAAWPLNVRSFRDTDAYNRYVGSQIGSIRPGAVYLHYQQRDRRELIINRGSAGEGQALSYQAFIQFLRAFVSNPPSWIREGFAVFFNNLGFDEDGDLSYEENLLWLETVKSLEYLPMPGAILMADVLGMPDDFQSLAWSIVSFMLNSGKHDYLRTMTDSFMLLSDSKSAEENSAEVMKHIFLWNDMEEFDKDYREYLDSRKSFSELLAEGQRAYDIGDTGAAILAFRDALDLRPRHFAPRYYLGLLAYELGDYDTARQYYRSSMQYGADQALVLYAMGLNSAAAGRNSEAVEFLRQAAETAPARYREKTQAIITRLEK